MIVALITSIVILMRMRAYPCFCGRTASELNYSKGPNLILFLNMWLFLAAFEYVMSFLLNLSGGRASWIAVFQLWLFWSAVGGLPFLLVARSRFCHNFERDIRLVTDQHLLKIQVEKLSEKELLGLAKLAADFGQHTNASIITEQLSGRANLQIAGKTEDELQHMLKVALRDKNAPKADFISKRLMVGPDDEVCD